jgi:hypothetical protein
MEFFLVGKDPKQLPSAGKKKPANKKTNDARSMFLVIVSLAM